MLVKICGIQNEKDLEVARLAGADLVGFIVDPSSKHFIAPKTAFNLNKKLNSQQSVLVVDNIQPADQLYQDIQPDYIQLHSLNKDLLIYFKNQQVKTIQAINVVDRSVIKTALEIEGLVDFILLDSKKTNQPSSLHDLNISAEISSLIPGKIILAGGLKPANIQRAIKKVKPVGVDANSFLNKESGYKDLELAREFVALAKGIN